MSERAGSEARLRVGIVGAGFGGAVHAPAYVATGEYDVIAIASPNRAAETAKARRIPHAFRSLGEMLAGCELDVVSIATPPYRHRAEVLTALRHGKHVLCEKPFGLNVAEAEEMLAAARDAGTVCALAHEFRYLPSRLAIAELIRNGHLGPLREIESAWSSTFLAEAGTRPNSWWFERRRGGGISGAILSHLIDGATWLAGAAVASACGTERTANTTRGPADARFTSDVADGAFALVTYENAVVGRASADGTHAFESALLAVHGERATAVASGASMTESATFVVDDDESSELELRPSRYAKLAAAHPNLPAFADLAADLARRIRGEETPVLPTFADGLATQQILARVGYETASIAADA